MPPASNSSSKIPSNSVIIADIGLHTIKSGYTLGHTNLAYDDSNTQSLASSTNAAAKGGSFLTASSSSSSSIGEAEATITCRRTCGMDIEYHVMDPDAIVESCISSLPSFASWRKKIDQIILANKNNEDNNDQDSAVGDLDRGNSVAGFIYNREARFDELKNEIPGCVALLLPFGIRRGCVEKILEALFEGPAPPRVFLGCSSLQALHAVGVTSGTVVDVGQFETRILPATDGSCHRHFALRNKNLGAAYQGLASVCSLMKQAHNLQQQETFNAINEHFLSKNYMKKTADGSNNDIALASIGDFSDDLVKIFTLGASNLGSAWHNYPLMKNHQQARSSFKNDDAAESNLLHHLPDGNKIDLFMINNNNNNSSSENQDRCFFPINSVLQLQDSFDDYLFDPSSPNTIAAINDMSMSTPLFRTLAQSLSPFYHSSSTSSSVNNNNSNLMNRMMTMTMMMPPTINLTNSLRHVLRSICDDAAGNHNSTIFRSAVSNIVLAGGGSVHPGVESNFTRTVESAEFANGCVTGGAVSTLPINSMGSFEFFSSSASSAFSLNGNNNKKGENLMMMNREQQQKGGKNNNNNNNAFTSSSSISASRPTVKTLRNRLNAPWIGGALFTQLSSLSDVTVSSSTFAQEGPSRCAHVYGVGGWRS